MRLVVLGAAAGGGLPQWNCNCALCRAAWDGDVAPRSQASIAASVDGERWLMINASPDIRSQILATPLMQPRDPARYGLRDSPIDAVAITNADIDAIAGLLTLREKQKFTLYATPRVHSVLDANPIFEALDRDLVARANIALDTPFAALPGLEMELFAVPGKVALFLEGAAEGAGGLKLDQETEDTVGVRLTETATGKTAFHIPGCARLSDALAARLRGADLLFFDGTVYVDDEMQAAGVGAKTGARMGHMHMAGETGAMAAIAPLNVARKYFIHVNNTNPVWRADSPERAELRRQGWALADDGMVITL